MHSARSEQPIEQIEDPAGHRFFALRAGQFAQQIESHGVVGEQSPLSSGGRAGAAFGSLEPPFENFVGEVEAEVIQAQRHSFRWAAQELRQLLQVGGAFRIYAGIQENELRTRLPEKLGNRGAISAPFADVIAPAGQPARR